MDVKVKQGFFVRTPLVPDQLLCTAAYCNLSVEVVLLIGNRHSFFSLPTG